MSFLKEYQDQRTILSIENLEEFHISQEWKKLNAIKEKYPEFNFAVRFGNWQPFAAIGEDILFDMEQLNIPYFLGNFITNFDQLNYILELGVSDVYLTEEICFDLMRAKKLCSAHGVTVRAFPNVGQSCVKQTPALKKFFVRPEDVSVYEDCIDIFEFWGPLDRQEILLRIYSSEKWLGDLKDLILDFDLSADSMRIIPPFAQIRKNCKRKCMAGEPCKICDRIVNISKSLARKNLMVKHKKNN